jgi:hypothetical protein
MSYPSPMEQGGDPAAPLYAAFTETSVTYPQNLIGVSVVVGRSALDGIAAGAMTWEDVVASQLTGGHLETSVARTVAEHERVGFFRNHRLSAILPHVYAATLGNVMTSVAELGRPNPRELSQTGPPTTADIAEAHAYLFHGEDATARLTAVRDLLAVAEARLFRKGGAALHYAAKYRGALLGKPSLAFPESEAATVPQKRTLLAHYIRQILGPAVLDAIPNHGIEARHASAFVHNITRP